MAHNNFVAVSVSNVSNASNQYMMCDGVVSRTIFNKPVDVLGTIYTLLLVARMLILILMVN